MSKCASVAELILCLIRSYFDFSGFDGNIDSQGELILQESFQVWDPKTLIRKGRDRHLFLFEMSLVFSKEVKDSNGRSKYLYKSKLFVRRSLICYNKSLRRVLCRLTKALLTVVPLYVWLLLFSAFFYRHQSSEWRNMWRGILVSLRCGLAGRRPQITRLFSRYEPAMLCGFLLRALNPKIFGVANATLKCSYCSYEGG